MANKLHPDVRIDKLETALARKDRELAAVYKQLAELSRRLTYVSQAQSALSTKVSRLS